MDGYDPYFGDTFWFEGFDHAETLACIECPTVIIHANYTFDENGVLLGAMSGEDAVHVNALIEGSKLIEIDAGHDVHFEKPDDFVKVMIDFLDENN